MSRRPPGSFAVVSQTQSIDTFMNDAAHTLTWIVELLRRLDIPFQAVGGLAARAYGAKRPLADLDFYVPTARLADIARATAPYVVRRPSHYSDPSWDLIFMKIEHEGCEVELGGANGARFFDRRAAQWCEAAIDFDLSVERCVLGVLVPVMPVEQLVTYKRQLARDVDQEDVADIVAWSRLTSPTPGGGPGEREE